MEKLSILMPVYNEEKTLREIIGKVLSVQFPIPFELIIVDDHSKDASAAIMRSFKDKRIKCFFHKRNFGKGRAVRTALREASGSIMVVQDADLEYDPKDLLPMLYVLLNTKAHVVYGSRYLIPARPGYRLFYLGNKFLTWSASLLYWRRITDLLTCYKMFRRSAIKGVSLTRDGFGFDPELSAKLMRKGYKIYEVPINYYGRSFSEGKKVTIRDGVYTLWYLILYRFGG